MFIFYLIFSSEFWSLILNCVWDIHIHIFHNLLTIKLSIYNTFSSKPGNRFLSLAIEQCFCNHDCKWGSHLSHSSLYSPNPNITKILNSLPSKHFSHHPYLAIWCYWIQTLLSFILKPLHSYFNLHTLSNADLLRVYR